MAQTGHENAAIAGEKIPEVAFYEQKASKVTINIRLVQKVQFLRSLTNSRNLMTNRTCRTTTDLRVTALMQRYEPHSFGTDKKVGSGTLTRWNSALVVRIHDGKGGTSSAQTARCVYDESGSGNSRVRVSSMLTSEDSVVNQGDRPPLPKPELTSIRKIRRNRPEFERR